ncbi:MAG: hypothetical protein KatS3mg129_1985 [Leptospiraceae bacterium]|nr:MAG: hypothetical protein KatS3mg129_1985 [Leptospiraceae bacterium]
MNNTNIIIFPHINSLNEFIPMNKKKYYIGIIFSETNQKTYYIIFYNKLLCKRKIENFKLFPIKPLYTNHNLVKYYFLDRGKRIYFLS